MQYQCARGACIFETTAATPEVLPAYLVDDSRTDHYRSIKNLELSQYYTYEDLLFRTQPNW